MSIFVKPVPAPTSKTKDSQRVALFYAGILVIMAVAQLFSFEDFLKLITDFGFPGGAQFAYFLAAYLVTVEVFALPFLLRMPLSVAFRWLSMVAGWLVAFIWAVITVWLALYDGTVNNVGFLGTVIETIPGWWALCLSLALGILAAWASWGMWPCQQRVKRVTKDVR